MTHYPYIIILDEAEFKVVIHEMKGALAIKTSNPDIVEQVLRKLRLADKFQFHLNELA